MISEPPQNSLDGEVLAFARGRYEEGATDREIFYCVPQARFRADAIGARQRLQRAGLLKIGGVRPGGGRGGNNARYYVALTLSENGRATFPVYEDDLVTVYLGSWQEITRSIPEAFSEIDHLITDPPFFEGIEEGTRITGSKPRSDSSDVHLFGRDFGWDAMTHDEASELVTAVKPRRWGLIFSDCESSHIYKSAIDRAEEDGIRHIRTGYWVKRNAQPQLSGDRPAAWAEAITIYHSSAKCSWNGGGLGNVFTHEIARGDERFGHPTPKPKRLISELIHSFTDRGDLIVDPYAGSGTTGRAAKDLGRRCILIEKNPEHIRTIIRRMRQEVLL